MSKTQKLSVYNDIKQIIKQDTGNTGKCPLQTSLMLH